MHNTQVQTIGFSAIGPPPSTVAVPPNLIREWREKATSTGKM